MFLSNRHQLGYRLRHDMIKMVANFYFCKVVSVVASVSDNFQISIHRRQPVECPNSETTTAYSLFKFFILIKKIILRDNKQLLVMSFINFERIILSPACLKVLRQKSYFNREDREMSVENALA